MDRRTISDFWAKLLFYLNILAWILLLFILVIFHRAQPEFETVFDRFYQLNLRTDWDLQYLYYLIYTVIFGILISLSGLLLSIFRGRREKDHKKALIITGIISLIMLLAAMNVV
ncbi:MAG: hypothetical protein DRH34_05515 [Deltaproteobacteria bacterium]|nr:MAG: hypothetical protein DRH34_05515 [Deltaproteobacteria bacterium]RLC23490.1 MAG: hypothetical protein DRH93_07140 [Deltaproteobacteria bacterium]